MTKETTTTSHSNPHQEPTLFEFETTLAEDLKAYRKIITNHVRKRTWPSCTISVVDNTLCIYQVYYVDGKNLNMQNSTVHKTFINMFRSMFAALLGLAQKHKLNVLIMPKYRGHFPASKYFLDLGMVDLQRCSRLNEFPAAFTDSLSGVVAQKSFTGLCNVGWFYDRANSKELLYV